MPFFFGSYSCLKPFRKVLPRAFLPNCFQNQLFLYCCRNALHLIQSLYINTLTANKSSTLSDPFLEMIQYGRSINKNKRKTFNYAMNIENFLCFVSLNKHDGHWFRNCDHGSEDHSAWTFEHYQMQQNMIQGERVYLDLWELDQN